MVVAVCCCGNCVQRLCQLFMAEAHKGITPSGRLRETHARSHTLVLQRLFMRGLLNCDGRPAHQRRPCCVVCLVLVCCFLQHTHAVSAQKSCCARALSHHLIDHICCKYTNFLGFALSPAQSPLSSTSIQQPLTQTTMTIRACFSFCYTACFALVCA